MAPTSAASTSSVSMRMKDAATAVRRSSHEGPLTKEEEDEEEAEASIEDQEEEEQDENDVEDNAEEEEQVEQYEERQAAKQRSAVQTDDTLLRRRKQASGVSALDFAAQRPVSSGLVVERTISFRPNEGSTADVSDAGDSDREDAWDAASVSTAVTASSSRNYQPKFMPLRALKRLRHRHAAEEAEEMSSDEEDALQERQVKVYRRTPVFTGAIAPFSIMLEVPGFTSRWYVRTGPSGRPVSYQPNPVLLDVALAVSLACAVVANISIIGRFTERLSPKSSTMVAIIGFCIHDVINIAALVSFGVIHAGPDGYIYSEAYWMTAASTAASLLCTTSLVFDYISTKRFKHSGSGLTHKQTQLVTSIMAFLLYLSLAALIFSQLHSPTLNFLDSVYFTIITFSTVGFGDIVPNTLAFRIVLMFLAPGGIIMLGLVIGTARSSILEEFELAYTKRRALYKKRLAERSEARRKVRHLSKAVKRGHSRPFGGASARGGGAGGGIRGALVDAGTAVASTLASPSHDVLRSMSRTFSRDPMSPASGTSRAFSIGTVSPNSASDNSEQQTSGSKYETGWLSGKWARGFSRRPKTRKDLEAQQDESNTTLNVSKPGIDDTFTAVGSANSSDKRSPTECSPEKIEAMALPSAPLPPDPAEEMQRMEAYLSSQRMELDESWKQFKSQLDASERKEFWVKMVSSLALFVGFWLIGAGVFSATESWSYFESFYFAFIFSSTIGYGDLAPVTPAGRAFFTVWSLFGIGVLTILFAVLSDAWASMAAKRSIRKKGQPSGPRRLSRMLQRKGKKLSKKLTLSRASTVKRHLVGVIAEKNEEPEITQESGEQDVVVPEADASQVAEPSMAFAAGPVSERQPPSTISESPTAPSGPSTEKRGRSWARLRGVSTTAGILASPLHHKGSEGTPAPTDGGIDVDLLRTTSHVAPRDMPVTLARSAMAFHEHAQRFLQTQRPLVAHAIARIPAMAKAEQKIRRKRADGPTHRIRISEADRLEITRAAEMSEEPSLSSAVAQWLEMVALEDHLYDILAYSASVTEALSENDELKRQITSLTDLGPEPEQYSKQNGTSATTQHEGSMHNTQSVAIPRSDSPDIM